MAVAFVLGVVAVLVVTLEAAAINDPEQTALRELVDLLTEQVRKHQAEKELMREDRMVYMSDVVGDHLWLVMQRDVNWPRETTFEINVEDKATGRHWQAQSPINWDDLKNKDGHRVTDGRLVGQTRAVRVDGLQAGNTYYITEEVKANGKILMTKTKTYTTPSIGQSSNGNQNSIFGNGPSNIVKPFREDSDSQDCKTMFVCRNNDGTWSPRV